MSNIEGLEPWSVEELGETKRSEDFKVDKLKYRDSNLHDVLEGNGDLYRKALDFKQDGNK